MQKIYAKYLVFLSLICFNLNASHQHSGFAACSCDRLEYVHKLFAMRPGESADDYSARISRNILKTKSQKPMYICNEHLWRLRLVARAHDCQPQVLAHIDSRLI